MNRVQLLAGSVALSLLAVVGALYATVSHTHQDAAPTGAIAGRVVDSKGQPVAGAKVYADRIMSPLGLRPYFLTDEQGNFLIKNLTPGPYIVSASKEEDDYPPTDSIFHILGIVDTPQVSVYEQQTTSDVVISLTQRAPRLRAGVLDTISGKPINNAQINICRTDTPDNCYKTSLNLSEETGDFEFLVPPVPVIIEISSPGYETWTYSKDGGSDHSDSLKLNPGETKKLKIAMRPQKQPH
jgi:hypothetical protein